jgi:hypothetical protein
MATLYSNSMSYNAQIVNLEEVLCQIQEGRDLDLGSSELWGAPTGYDNPKLTTCDNAKLTTPKLIFAIRKRERIAAVSGKTMHPGWEWYVWGGALAFFRARDARRSRLQG